MAAIPFVNVNGGMVTAVCPPKSPSSLPQPHLLPLMFGGHTIQDQAAPVHFYSLGRFVQRVGSVGHHDCISKPHS